MKKFIKRILTKESEVIYETFNITGYNGTLKFYYKNNISHTYTCSCVQWRIYKTKEKLIKKYKIPVKVIDDFEDLVKQESYSEGYDNGYESGSGESASI